ncbi:phospholipid-translocating ATPase [Geosmithia morbida]|uniref:Phospholipid-transporting ATPase n=1 Tax=Geosmithia morbida TaxID=1094350 RepID=A0A9P4YZT2_9HYPO|nr:phospholipid-translocating ATPase [Geosmithia morbida]KAF4124648.1 phospholipid-translocating ATPase [Geosmithia morbida]
MADSLHPDSAAGKGANPNRARWATRRKSARSGNSKRHSLLDRMQQKKNACADEKGDEGGDDRPPGPAAPRPEDDGAESDGDASDDDDEHNSRTLYFNIPLPPDMLDESGAPKKSYARNKIRTAKYTAVSFVPKNLWFQFHNIANIFFLFLVILVFFPIFGGDNPTLNMVPLIFIVAVTAIKDAIEDSRRTVLDIELNNASVHRLHKWTNVNIADDQISLWRKFKKLNTRFLAWLWRSLQALWSKKAREEKARRKEAALEALSEEGRPSVETVRHGKSPNASPFTNAGSFVSAAEDIQMTPVHSPSSQHIRIELPDDEDERRAAALHEMKNDVINYRRAPEGALFKKDTWKNLRVGDFVRIYSDDEIPADIIILSTSDPDGACYVETKNLDGETNLKVRQALRCGRPLKHARDCERAEFTIESEPPQPNLYKYNGAIRWRQEIPGHAADDPIDMTEPISIDNLLLRGCNLRNTEWILGVVVFTGHDTKIMQNAGATPSKRARIAREMNFNVICNFGILFAMCLVSALVNGAAWAEDGASLSFFEGDPIGGSAALSGFITFFAALIVFQNLIPISLYITLEVVRTLQAIFIYSDVEMYYEPIDQPCIPKSWNISDDVGQIEYIFSDKTGTLTQNVMEFKKATINGQPYGEAYTEAQAGMRKREGIDVVAEAQRVRAEIAEAKVRALAGLRRINDNPYLHDEDVTFIAPDFVSDLAGEAGAEQQAANEAFMLALALCHTVVPERTLDDPPKMKFKAQSPDEEALVATARDMGFVVLGYSNDGINLNVLGEDRHYGILNTIEFNSSRKRMSSIIRMPDGRIKLLCKGADSIIYGRLRKGEQKELRRETAEHLELFAREGLRTLCIAQKDVSEEEYRAWKKEHDAAAAAIDDREEKLEAAAELIEQDLYLIGGTAIEDRLQDGVPDTIALLGDAGIKLWVLTGDKVETAINIGFSCNLLDNSMDLIHIKIDENEDQQLDEEALVAQAEEILDRNLAIFGLTGGDEDLAAAKANHEPPAPTHGVVVDGFTLRWVLSDRLKQKFLLLCKQCRSVLCCRVSPAQKAAVVSMVKNGLDVMTLSIGDGANDVAMIQEADVGVGIAGVEGRQAAMSSDYAIAQFRFLQRLVLVHGRWSYRRLAESISNFFYKNMVWTFAIFWWMIYCDFDITYLFDYSYILLFNLIFTSLPVGLIGVFDQDVSDKVSLAVPQLYRRGIERLEWTQTKFWMYMLDGMYQSVIVFFIPYLLFMSARPVSSNGLDLGERMRLGAYVAHPAVFAINGYIMINAYQWDWILLLVIAISDFFIFIFTGIYTTMPDSSVFFYGAAAEVYSEVTFWAVFVIVPVMCLFPRFAIKSLQKVYWPYDVDIIREQERMGMFAYLKDDGGKGKSSGPSAVLVSTSTIEADETGSPFAGGDTKSTHSSGSSDTTSKGKRNTYTSVDEDMRPIYPPSMATHNTANIHQHSQHSSSATNPFRMSADGANSHPTFRMSIDGTAGDGGGAAAGRQSIDRARPSYDRIRASMDRVRPSFEASDDFTSANRLSRVESSQNTSSEGRFQPRLRGLSLSKTTEN